MVAAGLQLYEVEIANDGPTEATEVVVDLEIGEGAHLVGVRPAGSSCTALDAALSCSAARLAVGESLDYTVAVFVDPRQNAELTIGAWVTATTGDPREDDNEARLRSRVLPPRDLIPTVDAVGEPLLVAIAREAEETVGLIFLEAKEQGERGYSVTSPGFRAVSLADVPDFGGTSAPEIAALSHGFEGGVRIEVFDAASRELLATHEISEGLVPIDLTSIGPLSGQTGPRANTDAAELAVLAWDPSTRGACVMVMDARSGFELRRVCTEPADADFDYPLALAAAGGREGAFLDIVTGSLVASRVVSVDVSRGSIEGQLTLDGGSFAVDIVQRDRARATGKAEGHSELAVLRVDVASDAHSVDLVDPLQGVEADSILLGSGLLPELIGSVGGLEITVVGRSGEGIAIERTGAASGDEDRTIVVPRADSVALALAAWNGRLALLYEVKEGPSHISVFDASASQPLFQLELP